MDALDRHSFARLIGTAATDHKPVILYEAGGRRYLYFQKYLHAEQNLHDELIDRLAEKSQERRGLAGDCAPRSGSQPLQLDPAQRLALDAALANNLTIISGGPGPARPQSS